MKNKPKIKKQYPRENDLDEKNIIPEPSLIEPKPPDNKSDVVKPAPKIKPVVKVFNLNSMIERRKLIDTLKIKFQIG
jgi:hypothetical protein